MEYIEKRANSRIAIQDDVTLVVLGVPDKETCILEDLSPSGAKIYSTRKLSVGNRVELRIPSPDDQPQVIIQAKILRVGPGEHNKPFGYGCVIESTENA